MGDFRTSAERMRQHDRPMSVDVVQPLFQEMIAHRGAGNLDVGGISASLSLTSMYGKQLSRSQ